MKRTMRFLQGLGALTTLTSALVAGGCAGGGMAPSKDVAVIPNSPSSSPDLETPTLPPSNALPGAPADYQAYQIRYPLKDTHVKLVDDHGDGYAGLYGVRNFRAVLNGVVYRGGANNLYNKLGKRSNMNPLPEIGLTNLCHEGFGEAVYLYPTNFNTARHDVNCQSYDKRLTHLTYSHLTPFSNADVTSIFKKVMTAVQDPKQGPVYLHCWNGWHASGLASALILRQFCGMDGASAVKYWVLNTDGNAPGKAYGDIRARIRDYRPVADFKLTAAQRRELCPTTAPLD